MKAPDKIYVPESKECSGCIDMRIFAEYELKRGIEYIRKDALMEWINNAKNSLIIDNTKALQLGKIGSFAILDALIEKLNEM